MSSNIGIPVDIVLDEFTFFDAINKTVTHATAKYNVVDEYVYYATRSYLPDGNISYNEIELVSSLEGLPDITVENPVKKFLVDVPGTGSVKGSVRLDIRDPNRFFIKIGDAVWGSGTKINREFPWVAIIIIALFLTAALIAFNMALNKCKKVSFTVEEIGIGPFKIKGFKIEGEKCEYMP